MGLRRFQARGASARRGSVDRGAASGISADHGTVAGTLCRARDPRRIGGWPMPRAGPTISPSCPEMRGAGAPASNLQTPSRQRESPAADSGSGDVGSPRPGRLGRLLRTGLDHGADVALCAGLGRMVYGRSRTVPRCAWQCRWNHVIVTNAFRHGGGPLAPSTAAAGGVHGALAAVVALTVALFVA